VKVALFATCVVDVLEPGVGVAAVRVLRAGSCDVSFPAGQTCCGQPAWNAGFSEDAARVARTSLDALVDALDRGAELVVVPAGSCATMIRVFWPELFAVVGDTEAAERARRVGAVTRELSELLATLDLGPLTAVDATEVAYHHSCHMLRELRIHDQPEALLAAVDGCTQVEWPDGERCCGFGGLFSFKLPEVSVAMADQKLASLDGADVLVGSDSSCLVHLRGRAAAEGHPVVTKHLAEILAAALPRNTRP
jgi:L-lactate dehydrogenase complex protein LldE